MNSYNTTKRNSTSIFLADDDIGSGQAILTQLISSTLTDINIFQSPSWSFSNHQESSTIGLDTARQITAPNRSPTPETVQRSETGQSQLIR